VACRPIYKTFQFTYFIVCSLWSPLINAARHWGISHVRVSPLLKNVHGTLNLDYDETRVLKITQPSMMPDGEGENNYLYWSAIDVFTERSLRPEIWILHAGWAIDVQYSRQWRLICISPSLIQEVVYMFTPQNYSVCVGNSIQRSSVMMVAKLNISPAALSLHENVYCCLVCTQEPNWLHRACV
jgi:hypothetical protein